MLALQAPVAGDLRQRRGCAQAGAEIERSADLCCNICKAARRIYGHDLDPKLRGLIQRMSDQAQHEYKEAIEAYVEVDAVRAAALATWTTTSTDLHRQFIQQIFESHAAGTSTCRSPCRLAVVARFYERLGDHAVNISHRVIYIATGWLPEHESRDGVSSREDGPDSTPQADPARPDDDDAPRGRGSGVIVVRDRCRRRSAPWRLAHHRCGS